MVFLGKVFGHVMPGVVIAGMGLWHLTSHIRLFFSHGSGSYVAPAWFPAPYPRVRYLELIVMLAGSVIGLVTNMLVRMSMMKPPSSSADGTSPSAAAALRWIPLGLNMYEHDLMHATTFVYAASALYLDRVRPARGRRTLCTLLLAIVFAQELFMMRVHSTDHAGVEGQLHRLLQAIVTACLATALLGALLPQSFAVSLVRSASITFQGVWFVAIGIKWIPSMVADGCSIDLDVVADTMVYRCHSEASEHHAKAVVNLQFGWCMTLTTVFVVGIYSYLLRKSYPAHVEAATCCYNYGRLPPPEAADHESDETSLDHQGAVQL